MISIIRHVAEETRDSQMNGLLASITSRYAIETGLLDMPQLGESFDVVAGVLLAEGMGAVKLRTKTNYL